MTVKEIVVRYLRENGFDGLCCEGCGCLIDELFDHYYCNPKNCVPGFKIKCPGIDKCEICSDCAGPIRNATSDGYCAVMLSTEREYFALYRQR